MPTNSIPYILFIKVFQNKNHKYKQLIKNIYPKEKENINKGELVDSNLNKFLEYSKKNPVK
jgi:hypothetical protein